MTRTSSAPIGVFDSGVGGVTVLRDLLCELPDERYVYFGDTGNCPYGVRTVEEIQRLSIAGVRFLLERGAKLIVVACNTASVSARSILRATFDVPFVVVVPAVKPAAERTRTGKVGIAATQASAQSDYLHELIDEFAHGIEVYPAGCPDLVTLAEDRMLDGPVVECAVEQYIRPMLAEGIDELVLACTHFPAMRAVFERIAGPGVEVIDSGAAVARQTRRVLTRDGLLASPHDTPASEPRSLTSGDEFWCSGDVEKFERAASAIIGAPITARAEPTLARLPQ